MPSTTATLTGNAPLTNGTGWTQSLYFLAGPAKTLGDRDEETQAKARPSPWPDQGRMTSAVV
jgi:hypothetical protein